MKQVLISEELLRQAIETLDLAQALREKSNHHKTVLSAYTALRAALEQPAMEPAAETVSIQEVWEAAGGNPGIKATKKELLETLRILDQVCDEADTPHKPQQPTVEPVSDEENERFSEDVSNFAGADPEATKHALEAFLTRRAQAPQPAKQEQVSAVPN